MTRLEILDEYERELAEVVQTWSVQKFEEFIKKYNEIYDDSFLNWWKEASTITKELTIAKINLKVGTPNNKAKAERFIETYRGISRSASSTAYAKLTKEGLFNTLGGKKDA